MKMRSRQTEAQQGIRQIPFRMHAHDKKVLMTLLRGDRLSFQEFVDLCTQAYMRGSPDMLKTLREQKDLSALPKEISERYTLSARERARIMDEIVKSNDLDPVPEQRDPV
jgi:hypothetical protein